MGNNDFFKESKEQSRVKAEIVSKYFWAWSKVVIPSTKSKGGDRIAYIDLFAGPGRYEDGAKSTPLLVLEKALESPDTRQMLVSLFNDADPNSAGALQELFDATPELAHLTHKPEVYTNEVGSEIVGMFEEMRLVPTLFFVDPWGYKGLSTRLINSVLKNWGSDCIFFFNYNRINPGISNPSVREHMDSLFGVERADELRWRILGLRPKQREKTILLAMSEALKEMGGNFILPFRFKKHNGRTSHHLIFVSKHFKGYKIMKEIMAGMSSGSHQGVPSFEYDSSGAQDALLFDPERPLDELAKLLLEHFAGRRVTMGQIYEEHSVDRPFLSSNYKQALIQLERQGKILASPASGERRRGTFADRVWVSFPTQPKTSAEYDVLDSDAG